MADESYNVESFGLIDASTEGKELSSSEERAYGSADVETFEDQWFCADHGEITNAWGTKTHHSQCNSVPMPNALKTINKHVTLKNIECYSNDLTQAITSTIEKKSDNKVLLNKKSESIKKEISAFYKKIITELAKIESAALRAVDSEVQVLLHRVEADEMELSLHQKKLMQIDDELRVLQNNTLDAVFLQRVIEINHVHKDVEHFLDQNESLRQRQDVEFLWSDFIHEFDERLPCPKVGHLITKPTIMNDVHDMLKPKKRSAVVELCQSDDQFTETPETRREEPRNINFSNSSLKLKTTFDTLNFDVNVQVNRGCFVSNSSVLLKDMRHRTLYLLDIADGSYKQLELEYEPLDIALFDESRAVVTLREGGLQIIGLHNFSPEKIVQHGVSFYAVTCQNNLIYLRAPYRKMSIMKISGELIRTVESDYAIDYMCASIEGIVYCTNYHRNKVFALTSEGKNVFQQEIKSLRGPVGITVDTRGYIYVAGWLSNSIHVLDKEGIFINIIGTERNQIYRPMGLSYDQRHDRLMVANASCISIAIYDINCNESSLDLDI